jgi:hypothetical protein
MTADDDRRGRRSQKGRGIDVVAYTGSKLVVAGYDLPSSLISRSDRSQVDVANLDHDRKLRRSCYRPAQRDFATRRLASTPRRHDEWLPAPATVPVASLD